MLIGKPLNWTFKGTDADPHVKKNIFEKNSSLSWAKPSSCFSMPTPTLVFCSLVVAIPMGVRWCYSKHCGFHEPFLGD